MLVTHEPALYKGVMEKRLKDNTQIARGAEVEKALAPWKDDRLRKEANLRRKSIYRHLDRGL